MKPKVGLKTSTNLTNICINRPKKKKENSQITKKSLSTSQKNERDPKRIL